LLRRWTRHLGADGGKDTIPLLIEATSKQVLDRVAAYNGNRQHRV
jgi:hypothetical protein